MSTKGSRVEERVLKKIRSYFRFISATRLYLSQSAFYLKYFIEQKLFDF